MPVDDPFTLMAPSHSFNFRKNISPFGSCFPDNHRIHSSCTKFEAEQVAGDQSQIIARTLQELETVLLGPDLDCDEFDVGVSLYCAPSVSPYMNWSDSIQQHVLNDPRNHPEKLLLLCAQAVSNEDLDCAHNLVNRLNQLVSIYGDPMQRLAAYTVEGLVAKLKSSGKGLYSALKCKEPPVGDLLSAMQIMYEVCPYIKFGYMAANGAIAEAFREEDRVHIIDFEIAEGTQWITLMQALAGRPGGPPHIRITGVADPEAWPRSLQAVQQRLTQLADSFKVPFEFHALCMKASDVQPWMLEVRAGEALAVNFALQLHHMPDESVLTTNPRDRLLRMVRGLNPKVMTVVEQEANTNTSPFLARFAEVMSYYSAVFESLDVTLPRHSRDRVNVEEQCLARDIVNIIACEGADRVERHEVLGKWRARMTMAGFEPYPLSSYVNATIKSLLESYSDNYRLKEENGALCLGWLNRMLIAASAWH